MREKLKKWAIYLTGMYLFFIAVMSAYNFLPSSQTQLSPNEFGNFIAGAMSPFAIFWLVMVYLQQREEMRDQVEQTKKIAEETQKQVAVMDKQYKKQYEPFFICHAVETGMHLNDSNGKSIEANLIIENIGGIAVGLDGELFGQDMEESMFTLSLKNKDQTLPEDHRRKPYFVEKGQKIDISFFPLYKTEEEKYGLRSFKIFFSDLIGRRFELNGQYQYGDNLSKAGKFYGNGTKGIKEENIFPHPAKIVSQ